MILSATPDQLQGAADLDITHVYVSVTPGKEQASLPVLGRRHWKRALDFHRAKDLLWRFI